MEVRRKKENEIRLFKTFRQNEKRKYKTFRFKKEVGVGGSTLDHLRKNESVTMETIGKLCEYFRCTPNDIVDVIFDDADNAKEKAELQSQIAALQEKLEKL